MGSERLNKNGTDASPACFNDHRHAQLGKRLAVCVAEKRWVMQVPPRRADRAVLALSGYHSSVRFEGQQGHHSGIMSVWDRTIFERARQTCHLHQERLILRTGEPYLHV